MRAMAITFVLMGSLNAYAQGIKLSYINNSASGWNTPTNWLQLDAPVGQTPIQRVPTEIDDVVLNTSLSLVGSIQVGGTSTFGNRCKSLRVNGVAFSVIGLTYDYGGAIDVWTTNGDGVVIEPGSQINYGSFSLHGGNNAKTDFQITGSTMGVLLSHQNRCSVSLDSSASARFVNSTLGGFDYAAWSKGGNIYAEDCTFDLTTFGIGDGGKGFLKNCVFKNHINVPSMRFTLGKLLSFYSEHVTINSFKALTLCTSGHTLQAEISITDYASQLYLTQPHAGLPNIIDGSIYTNECVVDFNGDLKLSGNLTNNTVPDLFYGDSTHVVINGQDALVYGGGAAGKMSIEFFGANNSYFNWPLGFKVDTLIINKTNCGKVKFRNPMYVKGSTQVLRGQLELISNNVDPYHLICNGNVDIQAGGGLFLKKNDNGAVAGMAVAGSINDYNLVADTLCQGLTNPYDGTILIYGNSSSPRVVNVMSGASLGNFGFAGGGNGLITFTSAARINNFNFLTAGKFSLGNADLTVNGIVTGYAADRFFITNGMGRLRLRVPSSASILFPVGASEGSYTPMTVQNLSASDLFSVRVITGVYANATSGTAFGSGLVNKTWFVEREIGGTTLQALTAQWNAGDELTGFVRSSAYLSHFMGTRWDQVTPQSASGTGPYTITRTGIFSLSPFAVMNSTAALPLKLIDFTGTYYEKKIKLSWVSEQEQNVSSYVVEESEDGINFSTLSQVTARNVLNGRSNYTLDDYDLRQLNFYRLKMVDKDGKFTYSKIISITAPAQSLITISPNPASDKLYLSGTLPSQSFTIQLFDETGKQLRSQRLTNLPPGFFIDIRDLPKGNYFLVMQGSKFNITERFIK